MKTAEFKSYLGVPRFKGKELSCDVCAVRHSSAFSGIHEDTLDFFCKNKGYNFYKKGQSIFLEGQTPQGIYLLQLGKVKIFKNGILGQEQIVRLAAPGDVLTYRALGEVKAYVVSAVALEDCSVCVINRELFRNKIETDPLLAIHVIEMLTVELNRAENFIKDFAQKTVKQRVAEALLSLKEKYGESSEEKGLINIRLSRDDLANIVGTATETLVRLLSEFKAKNLIATEGQKIIILNEPRLLKMSNPSS